MPPLRPLTSTARPPPGPPPPPRGAPPPPAPPSTPHAPPSPPHPATPPSRPAGAAHRLARGVVHLDLPLRRLLSFGVRLIYHAASPRPGGGGSSVRPEPVPSYYHRIRATRAIMHICLARPIPPPGPRFPPD